jgi:hypothetical protein
MHSVRVRKDSHRSFPSPYLRLRAGKGRNGARKRAGRGTRSNHPTYRLLLPLGIFPGIGNTETWLRSQRGPEQRRSVGMPRITEQDLRLLDDQAEVPHRDAVRCAETPRTESSMALAAQVLVAVSFPT